MRILEKGLRSLGEVYVPRPAPSRLPDGPAFYLNTLFQDIMVAIRLRREGSKDRPYYRIVITDSRSRRDGPFIDQVGTYDPMKDGVNYLLDLPKVDDWITKGAQPSETVASIIRKTRLAQPKA
jgi:small subunit ribosomal protein S16